MIPPSEYEFRMRQHNSSGAFTEVVIKGNEEGLTRILRDFRCFLIACTFPENLVDEHLPTADEDY